MREIRRICSRGAIGLAAAMTIGSLARADTATWLNAVNGNWNDATKWSSNPNFPYNGFPTPASTWDALINAQGAPYTIALNVDAPLNSLTLDSGGATLNAANQRLRIGQINLNAGRFALDHTTLIGSTINTTGSGNLDISGFSNEFDGITLNLAGTLTVSSGLLLNNTITLGGAGKISLMSGIGSNSAMNLLGQGEVVFDSPTTMPSFNGNGIAPSTLGPNITVRTGAGSGIINGGSSGLINQGLIWCTTAGKTLELTGKWTNNGNIRLSDGELRLGGNFAFSDLRNFQRTGGELVLSGTIDNRGNTLELNSATGSLQLLRGSTIWGGIVRVRDGAQLQLADLSKPFSYNVPPILDGVTLQTSLPVAAGQSLTVQNGAIFDNISITLATAGLGSATLRASGTQRIDGTANLIFQGDGSRSSITNAGGGTLTLGSGITITTGSGGGIVGDNSSPTPEGDLVLEGLTWAKTAGQSITITGRNWTNNGILRVTDGTLILGGKFTTAGIGTLERAQPGVILVTGGLNNTGASLVFSATTGSWSWKTATITGGTVTTNDATQLFVSGNTTISGVTLDADVTVAASSQLALQNTTTFAPRRVILAGPEATLASDTGQFGPMEVVFDGASGNDHLSTGSGSNFLFAPGFVARTGTLGATMNQPFQTITNRGTISAQTVGRQIYLIASKLINEGQLRASGGSSLKIEGLSGNLGDAALGEAGSFDFKGTFSIDRQLNVPNGGSLLLAGNWTTAAPVTLDHGTLDISGTWSNNGSISATDSNVNVRSNPTALGSIAMNRSRVNLFGMINGSTVGGMSFTSSIIDLNANSTLSNANNTLTLTAGGAGMQMHGATLKGGAIAGGDGQIEVVSGTNTITDTVMATNIVVDSGASLTLNGVWSNSSGTITSTNANLTLAGGSFPNFPTANLGTIHRSGGTLTLGGQLTNTNATIDLDQWGGDVNLIGQISRGAILGSDSARFVVSATSASISGATIRTPIIISPGAVLTLGLNSTFGPGARINLLGGASSTTSAVLRFDSTATASGSGEFVFDGTSSFSTVTNLPISLTYPSGIVIRTGAQGGALSGQSVTMNGTVAAITAGRTITVNPTRFTLGVTGLIKAADGGTITIPSTTVLTNFSNGTLTNGSWEIYDGSSINLAGLSITNNNALVTLSGPDSLFNAILGLRSNSGGLAIADGRQFAAVGAFSNSGVLAIFPGSSFSTDFAMSEAAGSRLKFVLCGTGENEFGTIRGAGSIDLHGQLEVGLCDGYRPVVGDTFEVIKVGAVSGQFDGYAFPEMGDIGFEVETDSTTVRVRVTTVPEAGMAGVVVMMGAMLRRRKCVVGMLTSA